MESRATLKAIPIPLSSSKLQAVPLSSRSHLNRVGEGLHGITGQFQTQVTLTAHLLCYVISLIKARRRLSLS